MLLAGASVCLPALGRWTKKLILDPTNGLFNIHLSPNYDERPANQSIPDNNNSSGGKRFGQSPERQSWPDRSRLQTKSPAQPWGEPLQHECEISLPVGLLLLLSRLAELPEEQSSPVVPVSLHKQPRGGSEVSASSQKQSTAWGIARPGGEPADQGRTRLLVTEESGRKTSSRKEKMKEMEGLNRNETKWDNAKKIRGKVGIQWTKEKRMRNKRHEKRGWEVKRKGGVAG